MDPAYLGFRHLGRVDQKLNEFEVPILGVLGIAINFSFTATSGC
jgi:hypothetical protein